MVCGIPVDHIENAPRVVCSEIGEGWVECDGDIFFLVSKDGGYATEGLGCSTDEFAVLAGRYKRGHGRDDGRGNHGSTGVTADASRSATMANNAQANALLAHVASQMQLNVAFLESQNYLSAQDAATMKDIIQRLPVGTTQDEKQVLPDPPRAAPVYARALWAYNENGTVRPRRLVRRHSDCRTGQRGSLVLSRGHG